ncbi:MAG: FKBP-type peptidyl-prolyl cis-trans isomerase [Candidatus Caenarcaniphilales bacterium]|nr:FKBP-type peptidyl-prolyl cis-trans isomerase [Candidatus Caenarcaniphilales bacterium]
MKKLTQAFTTFAVLVSLSTLLVSCSSSSISQEATAKTTKGVNKLDIVNQEEYVKSASGLLYKDEKEGSGKVAKAGNKVQVHYTGTFYESGEKFDSSVDRGQPFEFNLGAGQVIKGWDEGVEDMKVGGKRILVIPPDLAYGAGGIPGAIPPNSILKFEVELLGVN